MAVGHTRQNSKKRSKSQKANASKEVLMEDEFSKSAAAHESAVIETASVDINRDRETNVHVVERSSPEVSSSSSITDVAALDIASHGQPQTKSARRRALLRKKKQDLAQIAANQADTAHSSTRESEAQDVEAKDGQLTPIDQSTSKNDSTTESAKSRTKKQKPRAAQASKAKHSLQKECAREESSVLGNPITTEIGQEAEVVEPDPNVVSGGGVDRKVDKKKKQKGKKSSIAKLETTNQLADTFTNRATNPEPQHDPSSLATEVMSARNNPPPPRMHGRHKSVDVRLHLNGRQHKSISIDTPRTESTSPIKDNSDRPVKVRLPGREVTLVYPDDIRQRPTGKHMKNRSQATSVSSLASGPSRASPMRSRQSSHTTVGTNGPLESKLQNMILSHACESSPMTATTSMTSQLPHSQRSTSPVVIKASSSSAPPIINSPPGSRSHSPVQSFSRDENHQHQKQQGHLSSKTGYMAQMGQVPAVPTLYQTRSSQLHAPPSLGPPQPQNLPEQIPNPYSFNNAMAFNNGYGNSYPLQPHYYNYYPAPPTQNFGTYNNMPVGMQMPYYDQPINGTVYYNSDGTPIYPQDYYAGIYVTPEMYSMQQVPYNL